MTDVHPTGEPGLGMLRPTPEMFLDWDITHPSAWRGHAPFMGWIVGRHRPRTFVELGTHWGLSYFAACAAATAVGLQMESIAVDTWEGDAQGGAYGEEVYEYVSSHNLLNVGPASLLYRGRFDDAVGTVADGTLELLHIDGLHTYEAVKHDFETWLPKLSARGVVLLHDIAERRDDFGVHRFWAEITDRYPSFRFVHGHGLGVLAVGAEVGEEVRWLCAQDGEPAGDQIRLMFREYGRAAEQAYLLRETGLRATKETDRAARAEAALERSRTQAELREQERQQVVADLAEATAGAERLRAELSCRPAVEPPGPQRTRRQPGETAAQRGRQVAQSVRRRARQLRQTLPGTPTDGRRLLFDPAYYLATYPDVLASGVDPWEHYRTSGAAVGRRPSPLFDPEWYLRNNPEVAAAGADPVVHYLSEGWQKGLDPVPEFDTSWYLETYPDVAAAGANPLLHYLDSGAAERRNPGPTFDTDFYLRTYPDVAESGVNPLAHYLAHGQLEHRLPAADPSVVAARSVSDLIRDTRPAMRPLRVIAGPGPGRINLVTDSLRPDSLFGGVATALFLAALWAERSHRTLRVVCRRDASEAGGVGDLLRLHGLALSRSPEVVHISEAPGDYLEVTDSDVFLTTSWWTTHATLGVLPPERIVYLLQEDEREFYAAGIDRLSAWQTMNADGLSVVVNTQGLLDHLADSGVDSLLMTATSFEPSFAAYAQAPRPPASEGQRDLFYYARPTNDRNLFLLGLETLDRAIATGVLDTDVWRIHFAGRRIPRIPFCDGTQPQFHEELAWTDYRALISRMDLGLSLMATPHPSYPPVDLAAAGGVVVTNTWPGKQPLASISDSIIEAPPTVEALVDGLARGVQEVLTPTRARGVHPPYSSTWTQNLDATVERLLKVSGRV